MTGTSGRKRVNYTALELYEMPIPDEELLKKFEGKIVSFFERMTMNTKENEELSKLRGWLLLMLMNGQVTVSNAEG
ncbi:Type I restriction-modification system, specificity subunit S [hydrothermal vent metagenome]|uniref:Type I restriction-modification system, specificity subunit S n=1 Tax=hydrothermal vent metagenome TaxID=652676 RepID=A0A3B1ACE7_9ZZZZ